MADTSSYEIQVVDSLRAISRALSSGVVGSGSNGGSSALSVTNIATALSSIASNLESTKNILDILKTKVEYDSTNTAFHFKIGIYSDYFVTAGGVGSGGGGGGDATWASLMTNVSTDPHYNDKIHTGHIPIDGTTIVVNNGVLSAVGGGGGGVTSVAGLTGAITADQLESTLGYITSIPTADNSTLGGFKTGYSESGKNYAVKMSGDRAYVSVPWTDTVYTLPLAANGTRGGIQIGFSESNSGSSSNRNYAVQLSYEKAYVNVPWTDTLYKLTLNGNVNGASGGTSLGTLFAPTTAGTSGYELLSAGSGNMPVWSRRGNAQHNTTAQNASEEWVKVATIGFTTGYKDQPIKLFVSQRRRQGAILTIRFTPAVFPNMEVESFTYDGVLDGARLAGSGGTWSLYIKKEENYDAVALTLVNIGVHQNNGMTWTWEDTPTATADLPAGTDATLFRPSYYIGQTQVQTSSASQALAGISGINSVLAFNTNDITVSKPILPSGSRTLGDVGHYWNNIYSNHGTFGSGIGVGSITIGGGDYQQGYPAEIFTQDIGLDIYTDDAYINMDVTDITIGGVPVNVDNTLSCVNQLLINYDSGNDYPQLLFTKSNDSGYLRFENLGDSQNPKWALMSNVGIVSDSFITAGASASASDARLKDNITELSHEKAISQLSALRGVEWDWNGKLSALEGKHGSGLVAQEVQKVMPWAVHDLNGELSLNYNSFWGMAISVLQSHEERIKALEQRLTA